MFLHYTLTNIDKNDKIELEKLLVTTLNKETGEELMVSLAQNGKGKVLKLVYKTG